MQPLCVVDIFDESSQVRLGVVERLVVVQVHLLPLERFEETLDFGIVVRVAGGRL